MNFMHITQSKNKLKPERAFDIRTRVGKFLESQGVATIAPGVLIGSGGVVALSTASATIGAVGSGGHTVMNAVMAPVTVVAKTAVGVGVCMTVVGSAEMALGGTFEEYAERRINKYAGVENVIEDTVQKTIKKESKKASKNTAKEVTSHLENIIAKIVHREVKNAYNRQVHIDSKGEEIEVINNKIHKAERKRKRKCHYKKNPTKRDHGNSHDRE